MLKCKSTISKVTTPMDCMRTSLTIQTISRKPFLNTREFCTVRGTIIENFLFPDEMMDAPLSEAFFSTKKFLSGSDVFLLYVQ